MRCVLYARVSTREQNVASQLAELRRFAEGQYEIAFEIVDHGFSGGSGSDRRPGLKQLMSLVRAREVEVVIVLKLDRLFRSLAQLLAINEEFKKRKIVFLAIRDNVATDTPSGVLFFQVLGALGEFQLALGRERTMIGLDHARRSGKKLGRPKVADDQKIRELRVQGLSYSEIEKAIGASRGAIYRALRSVPKT